LDDNHVVNVLPTNVAQYYNLPAPHFESKKGWKMALVLPKIMDKFPQQTQTSSFSEMIQMGVPIILGTIGMSGEVVKKGKGTMGLTRHLRQGG